MDIKPINKPLYDKLIAAGVAKFTLHFSGGNDEGFLYVTVKGDGIKEKEELAEEIWSWAWGVYYYSGAGDGNDFGDDIMYDLVNKTVHYKI